MNMTAHLRVLACLLVGIVSADITQAATLPPIRTVFIIMMENESASSIVGSSNAPYINNVLLPQGSHCTQYFCTSHPSLPNYLWLEAGTDFGISNDNDPSSNHQSTTNHLVTLLNNAGISWKAYEESISGTTIPLTSSGRYAAKHDPFVYFDDVTGNLNPNFAYGLAHIRPYTELAGDLTNNTVAAYNFITPNLCDDMHDSCSPISNTVRQGDTWLSTEIPKITSSRAYIDNGVIFIVWDEGSGPIEMICLSPLAKGNGYASTIHYTHSSLLRTVQEIFNVTPLLGNAANASNLSDLFLSVNAPNPPTNLHIVGP